MIKHEAIYDSFAFHFLYALGNFDTWSGYCKLTFNKFKAARLLLVLNQISLGEKFANSKLGPSQFIIFCEF